ncbi:lasso peptide biosynthesis PqqD family chaperone [Halobacillus sp. A5]|uniref:lasso peptide biosynthesis PqqD family chaperone n=1 Tax=Halobacillus sp. A5 TaxID=2880263 RepID=UPI0020A649CA|nr:lasso peptide biosynthesis PqqD family chaperone [Halobacillus sp. A5]MCP3029177.1 lasso peptide biosynthesis PqqD family chaperone [Halobacillus sp. A5]
MEKQLELSLNLLVSQSEGNIVSDMGNEKVMLSVENGKYYNLGEMGGVIWELIASPVKIDKVVDSLLAQYEVERPECERQVTAFINKLSEEGLIEFHRYVSLEGN